MPGNLHLTVLENTSIVLGHKCSMRTIAKIEGIADFEHYQKNCN